MQRSPLAIGFFRYKEAAGTTAPSNTAFRKQSMDAKADHQEEKHVRVEDNVLVRGHGRYVADAPLPNQAYAFFVRSPHAFARIISVDTSGAAGMPGVIAVLTAADMDGIGNISRHPPLPGRDGAKLLVANRPALAKDRVLHI